MVSIADVRHVLQTPLPGWPAQRQMAPESRLNADRRELIRPDHREGAVLIALYPQPPQGLHFVLIRRPDYDGVHSGQIALPGGKREPGETLAETAFREAKEEVALPPGELELLGRLSTLYIPPSNFLVYPFVAHATQRPAFVPDPREVAELIEVPLAHMLDKGIQGRYVMDHPRLGQTDIPFYDVFGHRVWGATAMILCEFTALLEAKQEANTPRAHE